MSLQYSTGIKIMGSRIDGSNVKALNGPKATNRPWWSPTQVPDRSGRARQMRPSPARPVQDVVSGIRVWKNRPGPVFPNRHRSFLLPDPTSPQDGEDNDMPNIRYIALGEDKQLNEIVVAGSHDAGITGGDKNERTQSLNIAEQAKAGIRVFDLRIAAEGSDGTR